MYSPKSLHLRAVNHNVKGMRSSLTFRNGIRRAQGNGAFTAVSSATGIQTWPPRVTKLPSQCNEIWETKSE
jgi:hypothetical protein